MISATLAPVARSGDAQGLGEEDLWNRTQTLGTVDAYEAYLRQFPLGKYTREAYRCAVVLAAREQSPSFDVIDPPICDPLVVRPSPIPETGPEDAAIGAAPPDQTDRAY